MIGERENFYQDTNYGTLVMRSYDIDGNGISAFYDAQDNLVFVLDNTINQQKPNVLLVINPDGDKKWDEILSGEYEVDLETIRPKVDNKYQKLDIEYSGLGVYESLINAYNAGDDLTEFLNQLAILRDSAARHSAMMRLNVANETISKTNATIVKTKESIVRLENRIKTLRSKLSTERKEIGRVNTKQSASKILKLESQIEATNEKLKRAKKRLDSAQRRLETATVDAELASSLLNQSSAQTKQTSKNEIVPAVSEYPVQTVSTDKKETKEDTAMKEDFDEIEQSDVKPLLNEDPQILNDDIAFKPISFEAPVFSEGNTKTEEQPVFNPRTSESDTESKPVLESMTPIRDVKFDESEPVFEEKTETIEEKQPMPDSFNSEQTEVTEEKPVIESFKPIDDVPEFKPEQTYEEQTEITEEKPVIESFKPIDDVPEFKPEQTYEEQTEITEEKPVLENIQPEISVPEPAMPASPVYQSQPAQTNFETPQEIKSEHSRPGFVYYLLLLFLILLSVFTLWLYQKSISGDGIAPILTAKTSETQLVAEPEPEDTVEPVEQTETVEPEDLAIPEEPEEVFVEEEPVVEEEVPEEMPAESTGRPKIFVEEDVAEQDEEPIAEPEEPPFIMDAVPGRLNTSVAADVEDEEDYVMSEEEILANKPVFEPGAKHDEMFIDEEDYVHVAQEQPEYYNDYYTDENGEQFYDEEEAAYQAEQQQMYY